MMPIKSACLATVLSNELIALREALSPPVLRKPLLTTQCGAECLGGIRQGCQTNGAVEDPVLDFQVAYGDRRHELDPDLRQRPSQRIFAHGRSESSFPALIKKYARTTTAFASRLLVSAASLSVRTGAEGCRR
jgi:hypothetical protein